MKHLALVLFLVFFGTCSALRVNRQCRTDVPFQQNFNPSLFIGTWFLHHGYIEKFRGINCATFTFADHLDRYTLVVNALDIRTDRPFLQYGETRLENPNAIPPVPIYNSTLETFGPFIHQVVATDYINYAFLWGCVPIPDTEESIEQYVLLSREPGIDGFDAKLIERIEDMITSFVDRSAVAEMVQDKTSCLGWPSPYQH